MELLVGKAYYLEGMERPMWDRPHPRFGAPPSLATRYLGSLQGYRRWHGFEVWVENREEGVLFMNDDDLSKLKVTAV
jgi:hypothetical protein